MKTLYLSALVALLFIGGSFSAHAMSETPCGGAWEGANGADCNGNEGGGSAPVASLIANPTSITRGSSSLLTWSSTGGATSCTGTNFSTSGATSGSLTVSPVATTLYSVTCTNNYGTSPAATATVTVTDPPIVASCSASPTSATVGQQVTWSASASGGASPYTYAWSGSESLTGATQSVQKTYSSTGTKTASVTITSSGGTSSATIGCDTDSNPGDGSVTVSNVTPTVDLIATPSSVVPGAAATLTWSSTNATSCTGTGFATGSATNNSTGVSTGALALPGPYNYQITCTGPGGSASDTAVVSLTNPTADISANPDRVNSDGTANITWTTSQCTNVSVTRNKAAFSTQSTGTDVPATHITGQTAFTVTCDGGTASDTVIVNLVPKFEEF